MALESELNFVCLTAGRVEYSGKYQPKSCIYWQICFQSAPIYQNNFPRIDQISCQFYDHAGSGNGGRSGSGESPSNFLICLNVAALFLVPPSLAVSLCLSLCAYLEATYLVDGIVWLPAAT